MSTVTIDNDKQVERSALGTITISAAADTDVVLGFVPTIIDLWCDDDGGTDWHLRWQEGMDSGAYVLTDAAVSVNASGGPVLLSDNTSGAAGFTIPAALIAVDDVVYYHAQR